MGNPLAEIKRVQDQLAKNKDAKDKIYSNLDQKNQKMLGIIGSALKPQEIITIETITEATEAVKTAHDICKDSKEFAYLNKRNAAVAAGRAKQSSSYAEALGYAKDASESASKAVTQYKKASAAHHITNTKAQIAADLIDKLRGTPRFKELDAAVSTSGTYNNECEDLASQAWQLSESATQFAKEANAYANELKPNAR